MDKERKHNSVIIGALLVVVVLMSIGFAAGASNLNVTSTATIAEKWDVKITGITYNGETAGSVTADGTEATFNVDLAQPGDSAIYTVTVKNQGNVSAILSDIIESEEGSDAISYTVTPSVGSEKGSTLAMNSSHTFDVKVEYLSTAIGDDAPAANEAKTLNLKLVYNQN